MIQVIKDIYRDSRSGKVSAKKFWGNNIVAVCIITYILDGIKFYSINEHLFDALLFAGVTMVAANTGANVIKAFSKKKKEDSTEKT